MRCVKKLEVQVLESPKGFYIGTIDEEGPHCRLSDEYFPTSEVANDKLTNGGWMINIGPATQSCSGGRNCVSRAEAGYMFQW